MRRVALFAILLVVLLAACTPGPNPAQSTPSEDDVVAGFWRGLWNGIIAPVMFFVSLFTDDISVYEVHNNGNWYDFGFVLGASMSLGGGGAGARGSRRHR